MVITISTQLEAQEKSSNIDDFNRIEANIIPSDSSLHNLSIALVEEQLVKAKQHLFKECIDSAKHVLKPLIEQLSSKNLLESTFGLEAQFLLTSVSELNNNRGEALENLFRLIESCKKQEEWLTLSRVYLVTELAYEFLDKPDRCIYYLNECRALIKKHKLELTYPRFCVRLSTYHRMWGDRDSSFYYAQEALRAGKEWYEDQNGDFRKEKYEDLTAEYATGHLILGGLYSEKGNVEKSKYHNIKTKEIWQKAGNDYDISWAFLRMSSFYGGQGMHEKALLYNDTSLVYGKKVFDNWGVLGKGLESNILLARANIFKSLNRQDSTYYLLEQGYQAKIDVINTRNHLYATEVEARHTDQQKALKIEQQIGQLNREKKLRFGLLGALGLFLLFVFGLFSLYLKIRKANETNKLQAEELKSLDKLKSKFFANISHELRTPLTLILGPLSYILDNPKEWDNENVKRQLLIMQRNGKSLMELIEEILDLSKLEANKLQLQEESTPMVQFFEYIFHVFEPQFQNQELNYELILEIKEDLNILLDRKKMEKVLNNFLSNAIKFTPKKGKISLKVTETDSDLHITVSDTGKGIHPKDLPFIFDRFYQSKQADQKLYGGTGIGLALVNEFAQLMGGKVHAESALGEGSIFFFEIPKKVTATKEVMMPELIEIKDEDIYSIGKDFTILVVEDNNDMRDFINELLQEKYNKILLAQNGAEGLEILKEHGSNINLIISDVMMPNVDGLTMLKEIKTNQEWHDIPVVMLTALAAERDKLTALTIGVDDYLTKPFSVPELLIRVQNLLFNYQQRMEWKASEDSYENHQDVLVVPEKIISKDNIKSRDKEWIDKLIKLVEQSFQEDILNVESLADSIYISSRQLNRKLKAITGLSTGKFIREIQLQAARKELESGNPISISEVAYNVGFANHSTFARIFKNRFGKTPSDYLRSEN